MYTLNGSVVRLVLSPLFTGYVLLHIGFCTVNLDDLFFDVSDGQFRCKINRPSSKFTALNLNTVERSEPIRTIRSCRLSTRTA